MTVTGHTIWKAQKGATSKEYLVMKEFKKTTGKPGKKLLMATLFTMGLSLIGAIQAEANPGNPPPPVEFDKPAPPMVQQPPARPDYRPALPPSEQPPPPPQKKHSWFSWPWW